MVHNGCKVEHDIGNQMCKLEPFGQHHALALSSLCRSVSSVDSGTIVEVKFKGPMKEYSKQKSYDAFVGCFDGLSRVPHRPPIVYYV